MSKTKGCKNMLNKNIKGNLLSQQNKIKELYDKENNDNKLISPKNTNDFYPNKLDNIEHNLKELPQYSSLYLKRLDMTKKYLMSESKKKWPNIKICPNILDLKGKVSKFSYNIPHKERTDNNWIDI